MPILSRLCLGTGFLVTGFLLATMAAARADTVLRVRLNADIRSTDPGINRDANTDGVVLHMVEGLVAFREDTSVGPLLADKIDVSEDGKAYSFTLRDRLKFHNGAPVTAEDVVWTWNRYLDPAQQWRCLPDFDGHGFAKIMSVEAKDARTVVFTLDKPSALFLATMARADCGGSGILHRDSVGADGKWKEPIGTGPFKMGEWRRGQFVELIKFDGYQSRGGARDGNTGGKEALVDKVRFLVVPDGSAAKAALLAGSLDVVADMPNSEVADLKDNPAVRMVISPTMSLNTILFQTKDPLLSDVRIRKAIALSIDTNQIAEVVSQGISKGNNSAIPSSSPFYKGVQSSGYKHDIEAAKKLLQEAGYKNQPIRLITNKRYDTMFDSAVLVQEMARQAGIRIELDVLDWATELDRYGKGDYQMMSFSYSARLDPSLNFDMFTGPKATQPRKVWDNREADALLRQSMDTADAAKRQTIFDQLHQLLLADVPMINLYNGGEVSTVRRNVEGFKGWATQTPRLWSVKLAS